MSDWGANRKRSMTARVVWLNGIVIEMVYFLREMTNDEVKRALIQADNYDPAIKVTYV